MPPKKRIESGKPPATLELASQPSLDPSPRLGEDLAVEVGGVREIVHGEKDTGAQTHARRGELQLGEIVEDENLVPCFREARIIVDTLSGKGLSELLKAVGN